MKAGVIGSPIGHSLSPLIFKFLSEKTGVALSYTALEVLPENLNKQFELIKKNLIGISVTSPHKQTILPLLDETSDEVKVIGATNAIAFRNGLSKGYNTDVLGIQKSLELWLPELSQKHAIVFGAGGAARAVLYALGLSEFKTILVASRNKESASLLAEEFQKVFKKTEIRAVDVNSPEPTELICQTTPLGMAGVPVASNEPMVQAIKSWMNFNKDARLFDLVYKPRFTLFCKLADERQMKFKNGLDMLICQALAAWEIWIGPLKEDLRPELLKFLSTPQNIFLTGFMGAGKTTVGFRMAQIMDWKFIDLDKAIEDKSGLSVPDIFEKFGEGRFRELEEKTLKELCQQERQVISLGGGAILSSVNRELIAKSGEMIYLKSSTEELVKRLSRSNRRPLLEKAKTPEEKKKLIEELLKKREPFYNLAGLEILTDNLSVTDISQKIIHKLGLA